MTAKTSPNDPSIVDDSLGYYFKQISKHNTLKAPEEAKVAKRIRRGNRNALEEIGKRFNITRERVRQIKERALRSLKHFTNSARLRAYAR